MSDTTVTTETGAPQVGATQTEAPQWALDKIKESNAEAAKYRVEKKDAVDAAIASTRSELETAHATALDTAKAENAKVAQDLADAQAALAKVNAAIEVQVPHDKISAFAELLKGNDEAELKSHAQTLREMFGSVDDGTPQRQAATDSTQGKGGQHIPLNGDPVLNKIMSIVNKK